MSSISVSSLVLGSLTMEVDGSDSTLALSVLSTAPASLTIELGTPGAQGDAATIAVGTTTTLAPGSSATVANVGTSSAAVFNFGIPAGQTGATGATGATGSPGTAATITAGTTTTGAPGSSASVTNSGTSSAAVFDFTIPRGDVGATGATGATGPAGPGVAAGGTTGQILSKASGASYDTTWSTIIPGDRYLTSSTTSLTIGNGTKSLTVGTGLSYTVTQNVTISFDGSNHMHGEVLAYDAGTGAMSVDVNHHTGSGTYSAWTVNVGGVTPVTSTTWGTITGTLSDQTDLQTALDSKLAKASNLSDLANAATARTNLGLGTAAVEPATKLVPAGGTTGQVLAKASNTSWDLTWATAGGGGGGSGADVQVFTTPGTATWTKPAGKTMALVKIWSGGNGGGSGSRLPSTQARSGGAGGTAGGFIQMFVPLSTLASTVTVTVGSGGAGGASVTTDSTNGNQGGIGTPSIFGTFTASQSSTAANGGTSAAVTAPNYSPNTFNLLGNFLPNLSQVGGGGNGSTTTGAAPALSAFDRYMFDLPTGGGGGGGNLANNQISGAGGAGGGRLAAVSGASGFTTAVAGGSGATGVPTLLLPTTGTSGVASYFGGTGGGGGGYRSAANGGSTAGAAGAQPGGGGGGGAASDNGTPSGAGGAGGAGMVVVISF